MTLPRFPRCSGIILIVLLLSLLSVASLTGCAKAKRLEAAFVAVPLDNGSRQAVWIRDIARYDHNTHEWDFTRGEANLPDSLDAILEQIEAAQKSWVSAQGVDASEWRSLQFTDWGGSAVVMSGVPFQAWRAGKEVPVHKIEQESFSTILWVEDSKSPEQSRWRRIDINAPFRANSITVEHGFAIAQVSDRIFDSLGFSAPYEPSIVRAYDLLADPIVAIDLAGVPETQTLTIRRNGRWAGTTGESVLFGRIEANALVLERTVPAATPSMSKDERSPRIYLSADGHEVLLHDLHRVTSDGVITEPPEGMAGFWTIGPTSRQGTLPARIILPPSRNERDLKRPARYATINLDSFLLTEVRFRGLPQGDGVRRAGPDFAGLRTSSPSRAPLITIKPFTPQAFYMRRPNGRYQFLGTVHNDEHGWYEEPPIPDLLPPTQ